MKTLSAFILSSLLGAALVGCGGSGGSSFSATKTGSNSGGTHVTTQYSSPVVLGSSTSFTLLNVTPNGQMVGGDASGNPLYWASPTSEPVSVNMGELSNVAILGINNAGQMVGYYSNGSAFSGLYWSSPTATPVTLTPPTGATTYLAATLNIHGQIVGVTGTGTSGQAIYWASPTSTPTVLAGVGGGSNQGQSAIRISDGGEIIGDAASGAVLAWTTPTANARILTLANGDSVTTNNNPLGLAFNQETGEVGGTATVGTQDLGFQWALPGLSFQLLPTPSAFTGETALWNIGANHLGVGYASSGPNLVAVVWPTLSSAYVDLNTLIPSGSGLTLESAEYVTDSGVIVGLAMNSSSQGVIYTIHPQ